MMVWPRRKPRSDTSKRKPAVKPYDREKEGKGTCSECKVSGGHRAGCWRAGT